MAVEKWFHSSTAAVVCPLHTLDITTNFLDLCNIRNHGNGTSYAFCRRCWQLANNGVWTVKQYIVTLPILWM